ncbi:MAG: hypothetical protein EPN93_17295 [Spirochaetes bacterium]|nr:MAG: hypothetical protein EPN93_17295 [Spirochaetota bacterium]
MIDDSMKNKIDSMDYESMLALWRNAPAGHPMFQGEIGNYYSQVMAEKRSKVTNSEHSATSKRIGWEGR